MDEAQRLPALKKDGMAVNNSMPVRGIKNEMCLGCFVNPINNKSKKGGMKKVIRRIKVIALFFVVSLFFAGVADAVQTSSTTLSVSTTVIPTCTVSATPVNFGSTDGQTGAYANGSITVNCVTGTVYTITIDCGLYCDSGMWRRVSDGMGHYNGYSLYHPSDGNYWGDFGFAGTFSNSLATPVSGTGSGTGQIYTVPGQLGIPNPAPPPGTYTDIVNVIVYY